MTLSEKPDNSLTSELDSWLEDRIHKAVSGDQEAVQSLMEYYRDYLLAIAHGELESRFRGKIGASDLVQESMLRANKKIEDFRGGSVPEFKAWLRRILMNLTLDAKRQLLGRDRSVQREVYLDDSTVFVPKITDNHLTPSTDAILKEKVNLLNRIIGSMSSRDQQVIRLRNWDGQTFDEIGNQLGLSCDGARKLWYRAIVRLQHQIEENCPDLSLSASSDTNCKD